MKDLRLVSGYDVLYGKVKDFTINHLFNKVIDLDTANTLRNLSEITATKTIIETFKKKINELTIQDKGDAEIRDMIKLKNTRPFIAKEQGYLIPNKSIFNKIIGDSHLELLFAGFLEDCDDIVSYAKNYLAIHFKLDYVNANGDIRNYYPDFIVNKSETEIFIIETKGLEDLDVPLKMQRLKQWCKDVNNKQSAVNYDFVYVDEEGFNKYKPKTFDELICNFKEYKKEWPQLRDALGQTRATCEQVHIIQEHLGHLAMGFGRFQKRMDNLDTDIRQTNKDVEEVSTSARKISFRFGKIEQVELENSPPVKLDVDDNEKISYYCVASNIFFILIKY